MAISIAEFETLLDTHGPKLDRWPEALGVSARILLAQSEAARQMLRAAQAVDATLTAPETKAPEGLADRIIGRALNKTRPD